MPLDWEPHPLQLSHEEIDYLQTLILNTKPSRGSQADKLWDKLYEAMHDGG